MNLAYKYPIIFWNTANLIVDSGSAEELELEEEDLEEEDDKEKKQQKTNYGKIASAIGKMQSRGIKILPPNINESTYTFTPNVERNTIMYGLKGIVRIGQRIVDDIMEKRPFTSTEDFLTKIKVNKLEMSILIKSGAFDDFGDREEILYDYLESISETKRLLNLRNANMLFLKELIPKEYDFEKKVFNYNKYLRKFKNKVTDYITLDEIALDFYSENFDMDIITIEEEVYKMKATHWKKIYDKYMDNIRQYIKNNHDDLLDRLNKMLVQEMIDKYGSGTREKWSMDSLSFYQDKHELDDIDLSQYNVVDFFDLPTEPEIDYTFRTKDGHQVAIYKIKKIAGTVIDRDKNKSLITLLTPSGVVSVKAYGIMPYYDKRISKFDESTGKKKVIEESWFARGSKVIVTGIKRDENTFFAKKYKNTPGHHFVLIKDIKDGELIIQDERVEVAENE